jgi:hypothetical protein
MEAFIALIAMALGSLQDADGCWLGFGRGENLIF